MCPPFFVFVYFYNRFADFDQHSLQMKVFADPFAVPVEDVSPEYQLELIDMQSSDTMRAAFRDKTSVVLQVSSSNIRQPEGQCSCSCKHVWKHVSLWTNLFANEAQQKQHPESTHWQTSWRSSSVNYEHSTWHLQACCGHAATAFTLTCVMW